MSKKIKKIVIYLGIFLVLFLFCPSNHNFVSALEVNYPAIFGHSLNDTSSISDYVCYIFGLGINLAIFLVVIVIAFGGIYYLVSYGRGKFTSEAKDWIKAGLLGLLVVVCSYLIAYTINPDITSCNMGILSLVKLISPNPGSSTSNAEVTSYKEIPIGTLTETLLTRTTDCYGFDQDGDPINGDVPTQDSPTKDQKCPEGQIYNSDTGECDKYAPTYMDHDRADCLTQLTDGAQKKSQAIAALSDKITELMDTCSCRVKDADGNNTGESKCDPVCDPITGCQVQGGCGPGGSCAGSCVGGACLQPPDTTDCCPDGVKDQIEHGPISVAVDLSAESKNGANCETEAIDYNGLDEFRCPNPDPKGYQSCDGSDIVNYVEEKGEINNETVTIIDQSKWEKFDLWQQLKYFQQKINDWPSDSKIQQDITVLDQARSTLAGCYLAIPYVDFLKTSEITGQQSRIILKDEPSFFDPATNNPIDASKYCQGFNYDNSSCSKKCDDMCPDSSSAAIDLYKACANLKDADQETCLEKAYGERPCPYNSSWDTNSTNGNGNNTQETFNDCMSTCQNDCSSDCSKKYSECSDEYDFCTSQCDYNGQCTLDNADSCLFGAKNFVNCTNQITDQGNTSFCINNAYLCKNGSDEYAGYPDCVNTSAAGCSIDDYSASSLYIDQSNNQNCQKCDAPYSPAEKGSTCYSSKSPDSSCQAICPETSKCPTSSKCPNCSCDYINQPLKFSIPDEKDSVESGDIGSYSTRSVNISAYQMVGPQCNEYSYNDDPLTFYCEDSWWNDPNREGLSQTPLGDERITPQGGEIPVGQTVDDSEKWANSLIKSADGINKDVQKVLDEMTVIGNAKNTDPIKDYCGCSAKFDTAKPICQTSCQYSTWIDCDDAGDCWWDCNCSFVPCQGSPCGQIVDYLSALWNYIRQFKLDFIDFYTNMIKEPRSDIIKELTYSRQSTNNCSLINTSYSANARLLSCTRVEDEIIAPVNTSKINFDGQTIDAYCYGKNLGDIVGQSLTDNWFCSQEFSKNPTINNNPIYNLNDTYSP